MMTLMTLLAVLFGIGLVWIVITHILRLIFALIRYTIFCAIAVIAIRILWGLYAVPTGNVIL